MGKLGSKHQNGAAVLGFAWCLIGTARSWHGSVLARVPIPGSAQGHGLGVPAHGWVDLRSFNPNQSGIPWDRVQSLGKAPRPLPSLGLNLSPSWVKSWCSLLGFTRAGSGWTPAGISPWKGSSGPGGEGWTPIPGVSQELLDVSPELWAGDKLGSGTGCTPCSGRAFPAQGSWDCLASPHVPERAWGASGG